MLENQTVWKSNNQEVKEETSIQTSRRGGDWQLLGGEDSLLGGSQRTRAGEAVAGRVGSLTFACGQTRKNNWGVRQSCNPGSSAGK